MLDKFVLITQLSIFTLAKDINQNHFSKWLLNSFYGTFRQNCNDKFLSDSKKGPQNNALS